MVFLERIKKRLTMAISPKDGLTPDHGVVGYVFIKAPKVKRPIIQHSTGYFLFMDFPAGKYDLLAGGDYYQQKDIEIDTSTIQSTQPFLDILLKPKTNYPFPKGMTVLKGKIVDKDYKPVFEASITVKDMDETAISEENGDFHLKFDTIKNDMDITLIIKNEGYETMEVGAFLRKDTTTHIGTIQLINA